MKAEDLKLIVQEKYGGIATQSRIQNHNPVAVIQAVAMKWITALLAMTIQSSKDITLKPT